MVSPEFDNSKFTGTAEEKSSKKDVIFLKLIRHGCTIRAPTTLGGVAYVTAGYQSCVRPIFSINQHGDEEDENKNSVFVCYGFIFPRVFVGIEPTHGPITDGSTAGHSDRSFGR